MKKTIYSNEHKKLLESLILARKEASLTQQELADMLGKPQSFIAKYEIGERRLDVIEFIHVCNKLGVSPSTLIKNLL
jgi:transcriptional regulator with XRE-family HTH domain